MGELVAACQIACESRAIRANADQSLAGSNIIVSVLLLTINYTIYTFTP